MKHGAEKRDFILKLINKRKGPECSISQLYKILTPKFVEWKLVKNKAVKKVVPITYASYRKWIAYYMSHDLIKFRRSKIPGLKRSVYLISKKVSQ